MLFDKYSLAGLPLQNRVVMAPMTRLRTTNFGTPLPAVAEYYAQRASAGLIITEGTAPSPNGIGYPRQPGIFNQEQIQAWRKVTDAVHAKGGKIFAQLMHVGRVGVSANQPPGARILAPSAIAAQGDMYTDTAGKQDLPVPEEMTSADIQQAIQEFIQAALNAREAGFDGVELHSANGYLLNQFLVTGSNKRTDEYGGPIENRARLLLEVADGIIAKWGAAHVGVRVSPGGSYNDMYDADPLETQTYLAEQLSRRGIAYLHVYRQDPFTPAEREFPAISTLRKHFQGTLLAAGSYTGDEAEQELASGHADLIVFGKPYLSNPDLVARLKNNWPLAEPDFAALYTPDEKGYTDYPVYKPEPALAN